MMKRMEKKREFFGLPIMFWGLWVTLLILWMGRFVTSFLSTINYRRINYDKRRYNQT